VKAARLRARIAGRDLGVVDGAGDAWSEVSWRVPADLRGPQNVEVNADPSAFTSYHYWLIVP
jgi:hypothetical protein